MNWKLVTAIIVLLAGIGAGLYLVRPAPEPAVEEQADLRAPVVHPEGYAEYRNEQYGFSYWHSPGAKVSEFNEGGGAMTIVHEEVAESRGLQIFIVPYKEEKITDERFLKDVPSGVRYNIGSAFVSDKQIPAVTFDSRDQFLGDTRELWFIYNGHLYEITTLKGLDEWLLGIIGTWRFN